MQRIVGLVLFAFPILLSADVIVDSSLSMSQLQITSSIGTVAVSGVTASAFGSVFDGVTTSCLATGALTGNCYGYDPGPTTASISADQGAASAAADADSVLLTEDASSHVNIPGTLADTAGTNAVGPYGDLSGSFEIVDASNSGQNPVTVNFSALLNGNQNLFMDSNGLSAYSEVIFNFLVTGMFSGGFNQTDELFLDSPLSLSSPGSITGPISQTLAASDTTLLTNTVYSFDAQVDAESFGANAPEPSFLALTGIGLAALLFARMARRRNRRKVAGLAVVVLVSIAGTAQAKYIGGDPPACPTCPKKNANRPSNSQQSNTSSSVSDSEGTNRETVSIATVRSSSGPTLDFSLTYNSYNADGSRATLDTVVGYGWTHSFNVFLFGQLGAMFRYDGEGRVTRYKIGAPGTFLAANGYFETLTQSGTTFTLTEKEQTKYTFMPVTGTPFLVGGPVYRVTQIVDRNGNTTSFTYTSGNLTAVTDTYGRAITFTYNSQGHLSSAKDPAGRVTTFQYDSTGHMLTKITDPLGKTIQYSYNSLFQITSKIDKAGRTFHYAYNSSNLPVAVYDANNTGPFTLSNPNNWATDPTQLAQNQLRVYTPSTTTNTDGNGNKWQYQYDSNGYLLQTTAPDSSITQYTYDPNTLQMATVTDANNHTTTYQYDSQGNLIQVTDALGHVTKYTYDSTFNMLLSITDPLNRVTTYTIDSHGNRISETDPLGQKRSWQYDANGNVTQYIDKNGNVTQYQYSSGNLIQQTDAYGTPVQSSTQYAYDAVGNRVTMTDALGRVTQYQYDGMNRVIQETDAVGTPQQRTTQTAYDGEGNRITVIDGRGITTQYQYDLRQRLITETDAVGTPQQRSTTTTYDGNDNRVTVTDPLGRVTTYTYDNRNRVIQETDATGTSVQATTKTTYDAVSNVLSTTDPNNHTTTYTYDALNRRSTMTDALGGETLYFYDGGAFSGSVTSGGVTVTCNQCGATPGSDFVTEQVDPDGTASLHAGTIYYFYDALDRPVISDHKTGCIGGPAGTGCPNSINPSSDAVTLYTYDPNGNRLTATEPDGNTITWQYDAKNRMSQETDAAGDVTVITYDLVDNTLTITSPNGNVTTYAYDALNRAISATDSIGLDATASYDADNNRLSYGDGNGNVTSYTYDALNRMITATDPLGKKTTTSYDPVGNVLIVIDRDGNTTQYAYDALNRRSMMKDALGNTTTWQYDPVGNLITLTDADVHSTQYQYDAINRPLCETYADSTMRCYTYDPVGNLTERQDAIPGQTVAYTFTDLYFLSQRSYTPSGAQDTFTYDLSGRMLSNQRANGAFTWPETFSYDGANRLLQSVQDGRTIGYTYNIPARTRMLTYPGGRVITEYTDARSRMDHIYNNSAPPAIVQYSYDLANNMISRNYANGTTSAYTYNANNWMLSAAHLNPSTFAGFAYAYDNEGNKQYEQKSHDPTHSECYGYDVTYRLISYASGTLGSPNPCPVLTPSTQTAYTLDPVGNWTSKTTNGIPQSRTYNSVNEITAINSTSLAYDDDGDLTNDGTYSYQYDEEHRLTAVTRISGSVLVGQYQYDALGRRVEKIANPTGGSPSTTLYFYDDARIIEEQNTAAVTQATYVYGNYVDEILTMDRSSSTYYYHQNALWSVEAITDATGTPKERYTYDAYGTVTVTDGSFNPVPPNSWGTPHSAIGNPWLFTGRQLDEETGLYYYRARSYDPAKGRFLQRDPLGYVSGANLYEYVRSRPTFFTDPTGQVPLPLELREAMERRQRLEMETRARVLELIGQLDDDQFLVRQRARDELARFADNPVTRNIARSLLQLYLRSNPTCALEIRQSIQRTLDRYRAAVEREVANRYKLDDLVNNVENKEPNELLDIVKKLVKIYKALGGEEAEAKGNLEALIRRVASNNIWLDALVDEWFKNPANVPGLEN